MKTIMSRPNSAPEIPSSSKREHSDIPALVFLFLLPFTYLYEASFIGQLYGEELVFLFLLPVFWAASKNSLPDVIRWTIRLIALWLVVQIATDIYNDTYIGDYLRGWARIIFFAIDVYVLARLLNTERRLLAYALGWAITVVVSSAIGFGDLALSWKFGVGISAPNIIAAGLLLFLGVRKYTIPLIALVCFADAVASLFFNARNNAFSLGFSSVLIAVAIFPKIRRWATAVWDFSPIVVVVAGLAVTYLLGSLYVNAAGAGFFGDAARQKLQEQRTDASDKVFGVLAGGRGEFYSSTAAIVDSPIVGYGSWARSAYYYQIYVEAIHAHGTPEQLNEVDSKFYIGEPQIPTHSFLFGTWVEAGIVGGGFWLFMLWRALGSTRRAIELTSIVDVLVLINVPQFVWNVFFSPFAGSTRLSASFVLIVLMFDPTWTSMLPKVKSPSMPWIGRSTPR